MGAVFACVACMGLLWQGLHICGFFGSVGKAYRLLFAIMPSFCKCSCTDKHLYAAAIALHAEPSHTPIMVYMFEPKLLRHWSVGAGAVSGVAD